MRIYGDFETKNKDIISVDIFKGNTETDVIQIGSDSVKFGSDPITIECDFEDTFQTIIKHTCTITLLSKIYLGNYLFANNARDITVLVSKNNEVIFSGFIEPCAYSQPFALEWEELQITCRDTLGTLEYIRPTDGKNYADCKSEAIIKSFRQYLEDMNLIDVNNLQIFYDGSVQLNGYDNIFNSLGISENLWLGDDEDDVMTYEEILDEILKYLNLHIIELNQNYYIFNWQLMLQRSVTWVDINQDLHTIKQIPSKTIDITDYVSNDTNFTIDEVFNQIGVKCDIKSIDTVITNPLNEDDIHSPFADKQMAFTEYVSERNKNTDNTLFQFCHLLKNDGQNDPESTYTRDWYFQVMANKNWTFGQNGTDLLDVIWPNTEDRPYQDKVLRYLRDIDNYKSAAALISWGHTDKKARTDDAPQAKLDMKTCIQIAVNGRMNDSESESTVVATELSSKQPVAVYNGNISANYSPADDDTTNYLVFSGDIQLVPLVRETGENSDEFGQTHNEFWTTYHYIDQHFNGRGDDWLLIRNKFRESYVPLHNNDGYYCKRPYIRQYPKDDVGHSTLDNLFLAYPPTDVYNGNKFEFKYSSDGTDRQFDNISKVPVLECELKIGDKYCVETYDDNGNSVFGWYDEEHLPTVEDDNGNTYTLSTFSLGFNPKIGDYIIGKTYPLQTNFDFKSGIDADEGTAIPIKKSDNLNGTMSFKILGAINTTWDDVTRRHPTWFRSEKFYTNTKSILQYCSSVVIENFECNVVSDGGKLNYTGGNDLIYLSTEQTNYINKRDDIEFKLNTQLTSQECADLGIDNTINLSSVVQVNTGDYVGELDNILTRESGKAEELYVDQNYKDHCTPKMLVQTTLSDDAVTDYFGTYNFSYLPNKMFYPVKIDKNLLLNESTITFREV